MRRVVKPGGKIAAYMWDFLGKGFTQWPLIDAIKKMGVEVAEIPRRIHASEAALRKIFDWAGIGDIMTRGIDIEVSYADFDDYWASQTGLPNPAVQAIRKLPAPDVEQLKASLREHLPPERTHRLSGPRQRREGQDTAPAMKKRRWPAHRRAPDRGCAECDIVREANSGA